MGERDGTDLYHRIVDFAYGDQERNDLMREVWSVTPWAVNVRPGNINGDEYRDIREWLYKNLGDQAWPIHGRDGDWQFGGATVFGETVGFKTKDQLDRFESEFPHRLVDPRLSPKEPQ